MSNANSMPAISPSLSCDLYSVSYLVEYIVCRMPIYKAATRSSVTIRTLNNTDVNVRYSDYD